MAGKRLVLICALILSLLVVAGARRRHPRFLQIFRRSSTRRSPAGAHLCRDKHLTEWGKSMSAAAPAEERAMRAQPPQHGPLAAVKSKNLPVRLPTPLWSPRRAHASEYVALVKSLVETYGRKLGTHRAELDNIFAKPGSSSTASQAGRFCLSAARWGFGLRQRGGCRGQPDDLPGCQQPGRGSRFHP